MNVLFLYSEVAAYFLSCAEMLHKVYGCEVHVVRWPVNPEAPFKFRDYEGVIFHERKELDDKALYELYERISPEVVYVSGWMDKGYVKLAREIRKKGIPVICGSDNHWRGDLRQWIAAAASPFVLKPAYSHFWVPGLYQFEFARRMGYDRRKILTGMYSADTQSFLAAGDAAVEQKQSRYPHVFLYVGRYVASKGVSDLYEAFVRLSAETRHDWRLLMVGAGPMQQQMPAHPAVTFRDFVQPEELPQLAAQGGCFVLPSRNEPWGVVMHEFAAAGLPVLASDACGSATAFLRDGYNGYAHAAGDPGSLLAALHKIIETPDEQLLRMGERSRELSRQITTESWAAAFMSVLPNVE